MLQHHVVLSDAELRGPTDDDLLGERARPKAATWTSEQVCARLNCALSQLNRMAAAGVLKPIYLPCHTRKRRYLVEDVEALIASFKTAA